VSGGVEEIEVRCPVPVQLPSGHCLPGKLLLKLRLAGEIPSFVYPDNLIELACEECRQRLRKSGRPVKRVLHRFNMLGELVETLTDGTVI
jgi:hypothetical protein